MKRIILIYCLVFFIFTFFYIFLFHTPLFKFQTVLFYRGLNLLFFNTAIFFILLIVYSLKYSKIYIESIFAAILISATINLSFFVVFPVTFERSVTMYLLNKLVVSQKKQSCQGLTKSQLENNLIQEYIMKDKAIDKRIEEQKIIGIISDRSECIQITDKAKNFLKISGIVKRLYGI